MRCSEHASRLGRDYPGASSDYTAVFGNSVVIGLISIINEVSLWRGASFVTKACAMGSAWMH